MHQYLLNSNTRREMVHLGVNADLPGHAYVAVSVQVDVADAFSTTQHCNLGVLLDVGHQGVAALQSDQVDCVIYLQQLVNVGPWFNLTGHISVSQR